jgi:hypothetical protein
VLEDHEGKYFFFILIFMPFMVTGKMTTISKFGVALA